MIPELLMAGITKHIVSFGLAAALALPGAVISAAEASGCTLTAPPRATAGEFFVLRYTLGNASSGTVTRSDGTEVGRAAPTRSTLRAWATNVLGPHTYILKTNTGAVCRATVDFRYIPEAVEGYDIVVVAGQSNASGRGGGPYADRNAKEAIDARILQMGRIGASDMKPVPVGYWQDKVLSDGLHFWGKEENDMEMAFALTFAREYVAKGSLGANRKVLIIPAAHGGSSLRLWQANDILYTDMVARTKAALKLPGENRVVAFLWMQVEADILKAIRGDETMSAAVYQGELREFFNRVRREFPSAKPYPILAGMPGPNWLEENPSEAAIKHEFEKAIVRVTRLDVLGNYVSTKGLKTDEEIGVSGNEHLNAASQVILGYRFYAQWATLMAASRNDAEVSVDAAAAEAL